MRGGSFDNCKQAYAEKESSLQNKIRKVVNKQITQLIVETSITCHWYRFLSQVKENYLHTCQSLSQEKNMCTCVGLLSSQALAQFAQADR